MCARPGRFASPQSMRRESNFSIAPMPEAKSTRKILKGTCSDGSEPQARKWVSSTGRMKWIASAKTNCTPEKPRTGAYSTSRCIRNRRLQTDLTFRLHSPEDQRAYDTDSNQNLPFSCGLE